MRTYVVGFVLLVSALACGGGGSGSDEETAYYRAFCKQFARCNAYGKTEQDCMGFTPAHAPSAPLVPDLKAATACMEAATSCDAAGACLPEDVALDCRSPTELLLCREGTCVTRDCRALCEYLGFSGMGACLSVAPGDSFCNCETSAR